MNLLLELENHRPRVDLDDAWPTVSREAARERILASARQESLRSRSPRYLGVAAGVLAAAVGSLGVAAATGVLPQGFVDAFSGWRTMPTSTEAHSTAQVDPASAIREASIPGPDGRAFSVYVARGVDGWHCAAVVTEGGPAPSSFDQQGDACYPAGPTEFRVVGEMAMGPGLFRLDGDAGAATRVEVSAGGVVVDAAIADGRFYGWYRPGSPAQRPTVTAYDAAGTVVGRG